MEREALLSRLLERSVLVAAEDGESLAFDDAFERSVGTHRAALSGAGPDEREPVVAGVVDDDDVAALLAGVAAVDPAFVAVAMAVAEHAALPGDALVEVTTVLQQFRGDVPPVEGVPDGFLPVAGDQLETLLALYPRVVLYVWREDCAPCELVVESLEAVFEDPPADVAPLAVFGADCAELLRERFDVSVLPTTLFIVDGEVDSRLIGAYEPDVYAHEVAMIGDR